MNRAFWKGRRVLVTGHTGFKGSWLCLWLEQLGAEVCGYALAPPTKPSLFELANVAQSLEHVIGDVRDAETLRDTLARHDPEIVLHLAAQSVVHDSYREPLESYSTNVMGTAHVLEAVRQVGGPRAVVNVTTDKVYENREWVWGYREADRLGGHDPYASSKACSELVTATYRDSFFPVDGLAEHGVAVATARAGNVIGGGDWTPNQLVPDVVQAFAAGRPVCLRSPNAVRPWQFVLEPLRGYLVLAERLHERSPEACEAWNFGPAAEDERPVAWLVEQLAARWGEDARWQRDTGEHPHEAGLLRLDHAKAARRLGWKPRLSLRVALEWVVEWYRALGEHADLRKLTLEQVARYEALLEDAPEAKALAVQPGVRP